MVFSQFNYSFNHETESFHSPSDFLEDSFEYTSLDNLDHFVTNVFQETISSSTTSDLHKEESFQEELNKFSTIFQAEIEEPQVQPSLHGSNEQLETLDEVNREETESLLDTTSDKSSSENSSISSDSDFEIKRQNFFTTSWTDDDDNQLINLFNLYNRKWKIIASLIKKNVWQCTYRLKKIEPELYASKVVSPNRWSNAELELFIDLLKEHGKNWKLISDILGTKTVIQCQNKFAIIKKQKAFKDAIDLIVRNDTNMKAERKKLLHRVSKRP